MSVECDWTQFIAPPLDTNKYCEIDVYESQLKNNTQI